MLSTPSYAGLRQFRGEIVRYLSYNCGALRTAIAMKHLDLIAEE